MAVEVAPLSLDPMQGRHFYFAHRENIGNNMKKITDFEWKVCSTYHHQMTFKGALLNYWPTTGKWQYQGIVTEGGLEQFLNSEINDIEYPTSDDIRRITRDILEDWQDDLFDANELYYDGKKESVLKYAMHLENKISKAVVIENDTE